jgi:hypothetical protein
MTPACDYTGQVDKSIRDLGQAQEKSPGNPESDSQAEQRQLQARLSERKVKHLREYEG